VTSLKCQRCGLYWSISTLWPDTFQVISKFCPDCIPYSIPRMGVLPFRRPA
jgi:hypothetical protein